MTRNSNNSVIRRMEARELGIHPFAQRQLVPSKLKQLKETMDLDAIGIVHAVKYEIDGVLGHWVVDGQHRVRALMDLGFSEWPVDVKIHTTATNHERACALFLKLNNRSPVSPFDKYENELRAGFPSAVGMTAIANRHGLKFARHVANSCISAVSVLKQVHDLDGGASLDTTLAVIGEAWGHNASALEGKLIDGLARVAHRYNGKIDRPSLVKKLAKFPGGPSALLGNAKGLMSLQHITLSRAVAEQVVAIYNQGKRGGVLDPM